MALLSVAALSVAAVAPVSANGTNFVDLNNRTVEEQQNVQFLVDLGIVTGTSATTFTPNKEITRGQVVKMLGRYLIENEQVQVPADWETKQRFKDVPLDTKDRELLKMAAISFDTNIFKGSNGQLNASGTLSRENMALVMNRLAAFKWGEQDLVSYVEQNDLGGNVQDVQLAKEETQAAIIALNALGISVVEQFKPKSTVKRVHLASFLARLLQTMDEIEAAELEEELDEDWLEEEESEEDWLEEEELEEDWLNEEDFEEELEEEEEIPEFYIEADYLTGTVSEASAQKVMINGYTFTVAEELQPLFSQQELIAGADVTVFIEEDVITSVTALTVNNVGSASDPINLDGEWLDDEAVVTMKSLYGHIENMDYYDEESFIIQPNGEAFYDVYAGQPALNGVNGTLHITYHQDADYLTFIGSDIVLTVMDGATVSELTTSGVPTIITYGSGELDSLIAGPFVTAATINGTVNLIEIGTSGSFVVDGNGTVGNLYGNANQLIISPTLTIDDIDLPNMPVEEVEE